ncbi:MAG: hypothetical protein ABSH56_36420 [Bryobacteraceae bacterium]|jgi:hypothetical protein
MLQRAVKFELAGKFVAGLRELHATVLIPGVQHAEEADLRTEVSGIAGDLEQRLGAAAE